MILTFSGVVQAVDAGERRVIAGKIAPYDGEIGYTSAGKVMFSKGSITAANPDKIKLLMSHDSGQPVGRMISIQSAEDGLYASFKISASTRGNDAILLAQEQLMDGLSVGVEVTASEPKKGYLLVTAATLREVSLVEAAAFPSAAVQSIAASESEAVEENQPTQTESEAAVTTAPETQTEDSTEAAPVVEAARPIIRSNPLDSQRVRTPITSMGAYTEHKVKAALGNEESRLYITAADDTMTTNPAFNPTQFLTEFVSNTRFATPALDACSSGVLPASGMTISVPSLVTSGGGQAGVAPTVTVEAEAGALSATGMVTEYLNGTVNKYSGMNTLSIELLERSDPNFYAELTQQLQNAYLNTIDTTVVAALVSAATAGTNTTADSEGIIAFAAEAGAKTYNNTGYFAQNYIGNTAQYQALLGAVDTTKRPIYNAVQPMNAAGQVRPSAIRGNVLGYDLFIDKNFAATTFDDGSAIILAPEAFTVYRSTQAYMSVNVVSNLQVQVAIYGFMATIAKMPGGIFKFMKT